MARFQSEVRVGLVMFLAFILVVAGLFYLEGYQVKRKGYRIYATFENVSGLREGAEVTVAGLKVGRVEKMELSPVGVRVRMWINSWAQFPRDSRAFIRSVGVIGEKMIQIQLGKDPEYLVDGDSIQGAYEIDIAELPEVAANLSENLNLVLSRIYATLNQETEQNLKASLRNIRTISDQINQDLNQHLETVQDILENLNRTSQDFSRLSKQEIKRFDHFLANLEASGLQLREASERLERTSQRIDTLLTSLEQGRGTLGKLLTDPTLYENLEKVTRNLDSLITDIRQRPRRYIRIELF